MNPAAPAPTVPAAAPQAPGQLRDAAPKAPGPPRDAAAAGAAVREFDLADLRPWPPPPGWVFRPGDPAARPQVTCPEDAAALVRPLLAGRDREHCLLVALDTKHRLIGVSTVSVGTADHTFMAPREIFRDSLLAGASAIFVAHNHPSGDASPSADDRQITRRLAQAGAVLGVDVLDHLVVGDPEWRSLARDGAL